jgi:hypothetical protein
VRTGAKLAVARTIPAGHDYAAVVGDNRKLVVFPLEELPEMTRGQGVTLQKYRDGGLSDATSFRFEDGLSWPMGGETGRTRTEADLTLWANATNGIPSRQSIRLSGRAGLEQVAATVLTLFLLACQKAQSQSLSAVLQRLSALCPITGK